MSAIPVPPIPVCRCAGCGIGIGGPSDSGDVPPYTTQPRISMPSDALSHGCAVLQWVDHAGTDTDSDCSIVPYVRLSSPTDGDGVLSHLSV